MATPDWQTSWHESHKNIISDAEEVVHQDGHSLVSSADYHQLTDSAESSVRLVMIAIVPLHNHLKNFSSTHFSSLVYCLNSALIFSVLTHLYTIPMCVPY